MSKPIAGDRTVNSRDPLVIDHILATIRSMESSNNYTVQNKTASASGAYQYIDSTWRNWAAKVAGASAYPRAYQAPKPIQDAVAKLNVLSILASHNDQLAAVPVVWYLPSAWNNDALLDKVPAGNSITVRDYAERWLRKYDSWVGYEGDVQTIDEAKARESGSIWDIPGNIAAGVYGTATDLATASIGQGLWAKIFGAATSPLDFMKAVMALLTDSSTWVRILQVIGGLVAIGMGFAVITGKAALETVAKVVP